MIRKLSSNFLVNPIHTLVVPFEAFDVTQVQITKTEAPVAMVIG